MSGIDLSKLFASNGTAASGNTSLAPNILEAFIPGYGVISRFILEAVGFDIGILVSACLLIAGLYTSSKYLGKSLSSFFDDYLVTSVYFDDHDDLYRNVLNWIAEQHVATRARRLKAVSKYGSSSQGEEDWDYDPSDNPSSELFHFGKWAAKTPPRYEPSFGTYHFWYQRRIFVFERSRRERQTVSFYNAQSDEEYIRLKTPGFSTRPIKALLQHIKRWSSEQETAKTTIRRPTPKEARGYRGNPWGVITTRHSRPMETVVLDQNQKDSIIADINEFLSPATPRWYATRGIPYRRGFLFFGPPGTGKSSLSFALAGLFGLDIHVISLLEPTLTEGDLNHLFNSLPKRCIVLLEDIDTAGLKREEKTEEEKPKAVEGTEEKMTVADLAKELKRVNRRGGGPSGADDSRQGISLSGLLNAIDGVASHEGRVLVMTTNHREKLDAALVRPGRVDMQIRFSLATKHQIEEIFFRMYWSDKDEAVTTLSQAITEKMNGLANGDKANGKLFAADDSKTSRHHDYTQKQIRVMSEEFAELVPEETISPAEVQNFLIARKKDPQKAMDDVCEWKNELLNQRRIAT